MRYKYTNEHIQKIIAADDRCFRVSLVMLLLAALLIFSSIYNTYKDIYTDRQIDIENIHPIFDTIYSAEITEPPVQICPDRFNCLYYAVRVGDDVIIMRGIKDAVKKQQETGHAKVRGVFKKLDIGSEVAEAADRYFIDNKIYSAADSLKYSLLFMDCAKISFRDKLTDDHPVGLVFGITLLVLYAVWELVTRSMNAVKHLRPACGSVRYTHEQIDELANLPESKWLDGYDMFLTPKAVIGLNRGLAAVEYTDIEKVCVRKKWHTESKGVGRRKKYTDYYTYKVIAKTKNRRRVVLGENRSVSGELKRAVDEKCGIGVWEDSVK